MTAPTNGAVTRSPDEATPSLRILVHNPASGGRLSASVVGRVAEILRAEGEVRVLATEGPGHASDLVESALRSRPDELTDVLALGGDGTLNEVLLGAWRAGSFAPSGPPVRAGIIPAGSTNVVARSLGLPLNPVRAAASLVLGGATRLDLGVCRLETGERPFLLACGVGFDAEVARDVSPWLKRCLGRHAYFLSALRATGESDRGVVAEWERADGTRGSREAASVIMGNCTLYAGIVRIDRRASLQDGLLELALLKSTGLLPLIAASITGIARDLRSARGVMVESARSVRVRARRPVPVHVDAEVAGMTPIDVDVLPRALSFRIG